MLRSVSLSALLLGACAAVTLAKPATPAAPAPSAWPKLVDCFARVPTDRAWSAEWTFARPANGGDTEVELVVGDGTAEDTPALRAIGDPLARCALEATGPSGVALETRMILRSQREGGIDPSKTSVNDRRPRVAQSSSAPRTASGPAPQRPRLRACVEHLRSGVGLTSVVAVSRKSSALAWTVRVTGDGPIGASGEAAITRFARCMPSNLGLAGRTIGPLREGPSRLSYASAP